MEEQKIWYAVIEDDCDDWGYGSEDYETAKQMMLDLENPEAYIAVIDVTDNDPLCIDVIYFDEDE